MPAYLLILLAFILQQTESGLFVCIDDGYVDACMKQRVSMIH